MSVRTSSPLSKPLLVFGILFALGLLAGCSSIPSRAPTGVREKKVQEILRTHPDWSTAVANAIADHKIFEGMTADQVVRSIGLPDQIVEKSDTNPYEAWSYRGRYLLQFSRPEGGDKGEKLVLMKIYNWPPGKASPETPSQWEATRKSKASAQSGEVLYVTTENANLRATPTNRSDNIIETLPRETPVTIIRFDDDWYLVRLEDGRIGWMAASVLAPKK